MRFKSSTGALILTAILMSGCALAPTMTSEQLAKGSLVYGYIDMNAAPGPLQWVELKLVQFQDGKPTSQVYFLGKKRKGAFWADGVLPGTYKVVGRSGGGNSTMTMELGGERGESVSRDSKTHFLGSWKYSQRRGYYSENFGMTKLVQEPTEVEVLGSMIQETADAPITQAKAGKRLADLQSQGRSRRSDLHP